MFSSGAQLPRAIEARRMRELERRRRESRIKPGKQHRPRTTDSQCARLPAVQAAPLSRIYSNEPASRDAAKSSAHRRSKAPFGDVSLRITDDEEGNDEDEQAVSLRHVKLSRRYRKTGEDIFHKLVHTIHGIEKPVIS